MSTPFAHDNEKLPPLRPYVPPQGPPRGDGPSPAIYECMGEANIFALCAAFYAELEKSAIRFMFSDDMPVASRRLAAFLVGVLGGPPLYRRQYGEPQMRRRHLAFPIDEYARRVWLDTFKRVLNEAPDKYAFPPEHLPGFIAYLEEFSAWMVNRRS